MIDYTFLSQTKNMMTRFYLDAVGVHIERFRDHGSEYIVVTADEMDILAQAWLAATAPQGPAVPQRERPGSSEPRPAPANAPSAAHSPMPTPASIFTPVQAAEAPHDAATSPRGFATPDVWQTEERTPGPLTKGRPIDIMHLPDDAEQTTTESLLPPDTVLAQLWYFNTERGMPWTLDQCTHALQLAHIPPSGRPKDWETGLDRVVSLLPHRQPVAQE